MNPIKMEWRQTFIAVTDAYKKTLIQGLSSLQSTIIQLIDRSGKRMQTDLLTKTLLTNKTDRSSSTSISKT